MPTYPVRHLSISIDCPYTQAYAYLANPENFPEWAEGLGHTFTHNGGNSWHAQTPMGPMDIQFTTPNPYGILDHTAQPEHRGSPTYNPLRLLINGTGVEIVFSLFQHTGTTDRTFTADAEAVMRDLNRLKNLLESRQLARRTA